ncbi:unnamed protein product [Clavelina lepadiformis]|uniref:Leucine-rich repeat protein SHOC-2 n=1 Tax=Clavelina lepadiformis TaxID=159417 RepID=A0ABP0GBE9_CLALP
MNQEQGALKEAAQKAASNLDYKGNSQAEPSQTDEMNDNTVQTHGAQGKLSFSKIRATTDNGKEPSRKISVKYEDMRVTKKPSKNKKQNKAMAHEVQKKINRCKEMQEKRLDLSKLDLVALPTTIKDMPQLTELYLYKNKLTKVPDELGSLNHLQTLALNKNHLMNLPLSLQNLKQIKMLDFRCITEE